MAVGHPGHASLLIAVAVAVGGAIDAATLRSSDHVDFIVDTSSAVAHSRVLAGWLGMDVLGDTGVPMFLPNVNSAELQAIVLFINTTTLDDVDRAAQWVEDRFSTAAIEPLCRLLLAAHYLDLRAMLVAIASTKRARNDIPAMRELVPADALGNEFAVISRLVHIRCAFDHTAIVRHIRQAVVLGHCTSFVNDAQWGMFKNVLHWGARLGDDALVGLLVNLPGVDVNAPDRCGCAPLHAASALGHTHVVRLLLNAPGIDANARTRDDEAPLHWAAAKGHADIVDLLLRHPSIDVNACDRFQRSPLHLAALNGHASVARLLVGAPDVNVMARNRADSTPLHDAVDSVHDGVVQVLLNATGINVNAYDDRRMTPLHRALQKMPSNDAAYDLQRRIVRLLLNATGVDVNARDDYQRTPLHWAARHYVVDMLMDASGIDVNARDVHQMTPLHRAVRKTCYNYAAYERQRRTVELLLSLPGINVGAKDYRHRTALDVARRNRSHYFVFLLTCFRFISM
ncbi:Ankyrin repeat domain-containing protein [Plasmodiophora brassicae]